jgi:hypothetical protein
VLRAHAIPGEAALRLRGQRRQAHPRRPLPQSIFGAPGNRRPVTHGDTANVGTDSKRRHLAQTQQGVPRQRELGRSPSNDQCNPSGAARRIRRSASQAAFARAMASLGFLDNDFLLPDFNGEIGAGFPKDPLASHARHWGALAKLHECNVNRVYFLPWHRHQHAELARLAR